MKDAYDKLKILSEILKNNWSVFILAFTALSSMATNASQFITNTDNETEIKASQEQIAMIANHYAQKPAARIVQNNCGICKEIMNNHLKELH